jgi:hypothetical protein
MSDNGQSTVTSGTAQAELRWYWLDADGLAWVKANLAAAHVMRHRRVVFEHKGIQERPNAEAVVLPYGGLAKVRRAGFKPREARVETVCGACLRSYVPHFEDDPCIAGLPGVAYACCGHGGELGGYILFENGLRVTISGPEAISRRITKPSEDYRAVPPSDPRFWDGTD